MVVTFTARQVLGLTCALLEIQGLPDVVGGQGSPGGPSCRKPVRFADQLLSAGLGSTPLPVPLSGRVLRMAKAAVDLSPLMWRHLFRFAEGLIVVGIKVHATTFPRKEALVPHCVLRIQRDE